MAKVRESVEDVIHIEELYADMGYTFAVDVFMRLEKILVFADMIKINL